MIPTLALPWTPLGITIPGSGHAWCTAGTTPTPLRAMSTAWTNHILGLQGHRNMLLLRCRRKDQPKGGQLMNLRCPQPQVAPHGRPVREPMVRGLTMAVLVAGRRLALKKSTLVQRLANRASPQAAAVSRPLTITWTCCTS